MRWSTSSEATARLHRKSDEHSKQFSEPKHFVTMIAAWIQLHRLAQSFATLKTKLFKAIDSVLKYWEIIADRLSKAGFSWGCVSAVDCEGRTIWIVDAHRGDGRRFIVRADEKLSAFVGLESATSRSRSLEKRTSVVLP
jgi:hypothetical protein